MIRFPSKASLLSCAKDELVSAKARSQRLLRMQNTSPDMIMTGYSVILKHQKAEQPQVFTFSPVSILPGSVIDVPLGGLAFVPDAADLASDQFQFGVDGVSGVALSLN